MELKAWAERVLKEVSESGQGTEFVRLVSTDGQTWHTWRAPFEDPEDWTQDAEKVVGELADEWPAQEIQLIFLAERKDGTTLSQCTKRLRGRVKGQAPTGLFGGPFEALAKSMDAIAVTNQKTLATANGQLELLNASLTAQVAANQQLMMQLQMERMQQQEQRQSEPINPELVKQAWEMLPDLLKVLINDNPPRPDAAPSPTNGVPAGGKTN